MLCLMLRSGESVYIGNDITVKITGVSGNQTHLGIDAPKNIEILRESLKKKNDIIDGEKNGNK